MTKGKIGKSNKENLYIFVATPSLSGTPNTLQLSSRQKFLNFVFIDTWVSGRRVGKLTEWKSYSKNEKTARGKILKGGRLQQPSPLLRERDKRASLSA